MLVIHGTKVREVIRGMVGDGCPLCDEVRSFFVVERYLVDHIYGVGLGAGKLQTTFLRCADCRIELVFCAESYSQVVSEDDGRLCSSDSLLTSSHLNAAGVRRQLVESRSQRGTTAQERLERRAAVCVEAALQRPPDSPGFLVALAITLPLAVLLLVSALALSDIFAEDTMMAVVPGMAVVGALIFVIVVCYTQARAYRNWYIANVIEPAQAARIDLHLMLTAFENVKKSNPRIPQISGVLCNLAILQKLVQDETPSSLTTG